MEEPETNVYLGNHKKINQTKLTERIQAEKNLDNSVILIEGAAGSGKTSEMLLLMYKCGKNKKPIRYLTYNKLLKNNIKIQIDSLFEKLDSSKKPQFRTLHKFFYNFSDSLLILDIITMKRINEIIAIQDKRIQCIESFLKNTDSSDINTIKHSKDFNLLNYSTRELCSLFLKKHFYDKKQKMYKYDKSNVSLELKKFKSQQENTIRNLVKKKAFLSDYNKTLEYLSLAFDIIFANENEKIIKVDNFLAEIGINIEEYWDIYYNLPKHSNAPTNYSTKKDLITRFSRVIGCRINGVTNRTVIFIDEGQDCYENEKNLLLKLFQKKKFVVATGGESQLIRRNVPCNWKIDENNKPIYPIEIKKRNKSYRVKPEIAELCNYLAQQVRLNIKIESLNNKDLGSVIIELENDKPERFSQDFLRLYQQGKENNLANYESIMFLLEANSDWAFEYTNEKITINDGYINENDNAILTERKESNKRCKLFDHFNENNLCSEISLSEHFYFYNIEAPFSNCEANYEKDDELKNNYDEEQEPLSTQFQVLNYESCRGLEAWSVMCLGLDKFFERKMEEDIASTFRIDDLTIETERERQIQYAMTWTIMALTRAIDTIYIQIDNSNSILGKLIQGYIKSKDSPNNKEKINFFDEIPF